MGVFESEHDMCISIHALLAESDQTNGSTTIPNFNFYPRSPCGERPKLTEKLKISSKFLSTLSLRRATPTLHDIFELFTISIHALLAESDSWRTGCARCLAHFYPRSPCGERQGRVLQDITPAGISIHALLAESDSWRTGCARCLAHFYPRSPCGERLGGVKIGSNITEFLSTLSLRRATSRCSLVDLRQ